MKICGGVWAWRYFGMGHELRAKQINYLVCFSYTDKYLGQRMGCQKLFMLLLF